MMKEAFEKAGVRPEDVQFDQAIALYLNKGGTIERARARLDLAAQKSGGAVSDVPSVVGQSGVASPDDLRGSNTWCAEVSEGSAGQGRFADKALNDVPKAPSEAQLAASRSMRKQVAATVLDSFRTRDGDAIGDIDVIRLPMLMQRRAKSSWVDFREYELFRLLDEEVKKSAHVPKAAIVRNVVDAAKVGRMIERATAVATRQIPHAG